jgi:hypothetical protein
LKDIEGDAMKNNKFGNWKGTFIHFLSRLGDILFGSKKTERKFCPRVLPMRADQPRRSFRKTTIESITKGHFHK